MPIQGHNSAAYGEEMAMDFDFLAFFDKIVDSSASAQQKLLSLVLARLAHRSGGKAAPRRAEVLHKASCSEATFKRSHALLKAFFEVTPRRGSTTEYAPKPSVTTDQIEAAISGMGIKTKGHCDTGSERAGGQKARVSVIPVSESEGLCDTGDQKEKTPHTPQKKNNIYNTPLTPQTGRSRRDPFGLNPTLQQGYSDVWFDGDDRLQVGNGFRAELIQLAGDEKQLRIELDRAAEWIGPNTPPHIMKTKVRGRVQTQISERQDRDRRYERAKQENQKGPNRPAYVRSGVYSGSTM